MDACWVASGRVRSGAGNGGLGVVLGRRHVEELARHALARRAQAGKLAEVLLAVLDKHLHRGVLNSRYEVLPGLALAASGRSSTFMSAIVKALRLNGNRDRIEILGLHQIVGVWRCVCAPCVRPLACTNAGEID